jgi:uncharacterized protein (TIGR02284 family)
MNHSETIEVLNDLIQINYDRIAWYECAITNINEGKFSPVKADVMQGYIKDSQNYVTELSKYIQKMGGTPATTSFVSGKLHRIWMDVKSVFPFNEKETVLEPCIFSDQAAITAYEVALANKATQFLDDLKLVLTKQLYIINLACRENEAHENAPKIPNH